MKKPMLILWLILALLVTSSVVLAMSSANYRLDWYELLAGSGGPRMASANYAVNITVGQVTNANASSANYRANLGYWSAFPGNWVYLPLVLRT